jgi:hypothetical protein
MEKTRVSKKQQQEKQILLCMIQMYCKAHRHTVEACGLCDDCERIRAYSFERVDRCPFMETKTFCSHCSVHCYNGEMRHAIRRIMRYAGPRMLFRRPIMAMRHMLSFKRRKRKPR